MEKIKTDYKRRTWTMNRDVAPLISQWGGAWAPGWGRKMFHLSSLIFFNDKSDTGLNRGVGRGGGVGRWQRALVNLVLPVFALPSVEVPLLRNFSIAKYCAMLQKFFLCFNIGPLTLIEAKPPAAMHSVKCELWQTIRWFYHSRERLYDTN